MSTMSARNQTGASRSSDVLAAGNTATFKYGKRPQPFFLCFTEDYVARRDSRFMSLAETGLLQKMRAQYWQDGCLPLPSSVEELAAVICRPPEEVNEALTPAVQARFARNEANEFWDPELKKQYDDGLKTREAQSAGGRQTADRNKERARQRKVLHDQRLSRQEAAHSAPAITDETRYGTHCGQQGATHSGTPGSHHPGIHGGWAGAPEEKRKEEKREGKKAGKESFGPSTPDALSAHADWLNEYASAESTYDEF